MSKPYVYYQDTALNQTFLDYLSMRGRKGAACDLGFVRAVLKRLSRLKDVYKIMCLQDAIIAERTDLRVESYVKASDAYRPTPPIGQTPYDPARAIDRYFRPETDKHLSYLYRYAVQYEKARYPFQSLNAKLDALPDDAARKAYLEERIAQLKPQ